MRKFYTLLTAVLLTTSLFAQSPEKMSYQAVIRDASDKLVTEQEIGMQISILQGSASGTAVYTEIQTPTSNANGLVTIEIGGDDATVVSGDFSTINWANSTYFIKTETDPTGGTSYTITGTSQLLSVPYALHAKTAETVTGGITESDPVFGAWDKSTGISITESQITDLQSYLTAEADPVFSGWDKSTGISITESQISDLGSYIETETDPVYAAKFDLTSLADGDLLKYNNTTGKFEKFTPDYAAGSHAHTDATTSASGFMSSADKTKLDGIAEGAEVNMQADWNQTTTTADDYIKNKPTIPAAADGSETKVTAGTNVTVTGAGTTASPYVVNATGSGERYLGEEYLGGIIFYLYTDATGTQKGLIVSKTETTAQWQSTSSTTNANRTEDGSYNTGVMTNSPAKTWVTALGADWYLPSIDELSLLWHNRYHVNKTARAVGSTLLSTSATYWSSTEYNATSAFYFFFNYGNSYYGNKTNTYSVRAVRAF